MVRIMQKPKILRIVSAVAMSFMIAALYPVTASADAKISITPGARLLPSTWSGENKETGETFSSSATTIGVNVKLQWRDLYGGISLAGGEYEFDALDYSPHRPTTTALPVADQDPVKVNRGEFDLVIGYYVLDYISVFVDIRSKSLKWADDYELNYAGLGVGVTAHHNFSPKWTVFGSLGASSLNIKAKEKGVDEKGIGDGAGSAAEFGVLYRMTSMLNLYATLKSQQQEYNYDDNVTETHTVSGATIGVSTVFSL